MRRQRNSCSTRLSRSVTWETITICFAWQRGRCRRETPVSVVEPDGTILEGVLDLAFEDDDGWTVVDWKTQAELTGSLARYRRQVNAYASVVARVTGRPARAVLMRL